MSNSFFSHSVFKRLVLQTRRNQGLFGKWLSLSILLQQDSSNKDKSEMEPIKEESESPSSASPTTRAPVAPTTDDTGNQVKDSAEKSGDNTWST